jgi:hypothetical protein
MTDWRVLILSALALLTILAGFLTLALPDSYEGRVLYSFDAAHCVRTLDGVGVALLAVGGILAWEAGLLWQRRMRR